MAINTQKFLPSSKETKVSTSFVGKSSLVPLSQTSIKNIGVIRVKVVEIDKILKGTLAIQKKDFDTKKRETSTKRREKIEEKIETKPKAEPGKISMPSLPRMGFLEWVKNFIGNAILGYFVVRLVDHLPKIIPIVKFLGKATDFVLDLGGKLLDGLVTFIDWGYKAYDATRGFVKNIFGENQAKQFDQLSSLLNKFLNLAIIAGMAAAGSGGFGGKSGGPKSKPKVTGRPRVTTSGGGRAGGIDVRNPLRQRPTVTTGGAGKFRLPGTGPKITGSGAKGVLSTVRPFLKRIPIPVIGALIDFGLSWALGEDPGRAAFRAIGAGILGTIGGGLAGALGLAGGPLAVATGALGAIAGGALGDMAGGALYDVFFGGKKPKSQTKKMAGGGITRGGKTSGTVRRSIGGRQRKKRYKRSLTPKKPGEVEATSPGSDVGGEEKLFGFFPNPFKKVVDTYNPFKNVMSAQKNLGDSDYFGPILAISSKIILGQKPSQSDYENVGLGINMLLNKGLNEGKLKGGLVAAFAEGGLVDPQSISAITDGGDISDWVAKSFKDATDNNAQKTLKEIQQNLRLKKDKKDQTTPQEQDPSLQVGPGTTVSGGNADFWTLVAIASREDSDPQAWADIAQSIYNRAATGMYTGGKSIKGIITAPGQYEPTFGNPKDWMAIADLATASRASGKSQAELQRVAAAIRDPKLQANAASFVGGRSDFMGESQKGSMRSDRGDVTRGPGDNYFGWFYNAKLKGPAKAPNLGDIRVSSGGGPLGAGSVSSVDQFTPMAKQFGLTLTSSYRSGDPGYHGKNRARDYSNDGVGRGTPQQLAFAKHLAEKYGSSLTQLIYTPLGYGIANKKKVGLDYWGPATNAQHYHHVHVAYERGGETLPYEHLATVAEKGPEIVVDNDSAYSSPEVRNLLLAINQAKGYRGVMQAIQQYAPYESDSPQTIFVPLPDISQESSEETEYSGFSPVMGGGETSDPFDSLYMGG